MRSAVATLLTLGSCLFLCPNAHAFCRTTTCNAANPDANCSYDPVTGCAETGYPLFWPNRCTWFGVQEDGSPKLGISHETFHAAIAQAFQTWGAATCSGGGHPSFGIEDTDALYGDAICDQQEFNQPKNGVVTANANVWMFRDSNWPYAGTSNTIALTTLTVDLDNGEILDADVELNSAEQPISTTGAAGSADLLSIVTHESGHFLGLAHTRVADATMYANYTPSADIATLAPDDEQGICSIYPASDGTPTCPEPEPLYGFSRYCGGVNPSTEPVPLKSPSRGCNVSRVAADHDVRAYALLAAGLFFRRRERSLRRG